MFGTVHSLQQRHVGCETGANKTVAQIAVRLTAACYARAVKQELNLRRTFRRGVCPQLERGPPVVDDYEHTSLQDYIVRIVYMRAAICHLTCSPGGGAVNGAVDLEETRRKGVGVKVVGVQGGCTGGTGIDVRLVIFYALRRDAEDMFTRCSEPLARIEVSKRTGTYKQAFEKDTLAVSHGGAKREARGAPSTDHDSTSAGLSECRLCTCRTGLSNPYWFPEACGYTSYQFQLPRSGSGPVHTV